MAVLPIDFLSLAAASHGAGPIAIKGVASEEDAIAITKV
jgi:hypothetical protein